MKKISAISKSDLGKSIFSSFTLFFLNNLVALFLTPYILKYVSKEEYGLYILCIDFLAWMSFLDLGINKVIETKAAHLITQENYTELNKTLNTALGVQVLVSILIIPLYFLLVYLGIGKSNLENIQLIISFFALSAALTNVKNLFSSTIVASRKIHLDNRIQIFINVLQYALVITLVPFTNLIGLAVINVIIVALMVIRSSWRVKTLFPEIQWNLKHFDIQTIKGILKDGFFFSLSSLATLFLMKIDTYIIGNEFNLEKVASYYISIKLFMLSLKVGEMVINNFRPHISRMYIQKDFKNLQSFYEKCMITIICVGTIGVTIVMNINPYFVQLWVGKSFYLNDFFNLFFGYYMLFSLLTLPARIVLVSSLYKIHLLSFSRIFEGVFRVVIIIIFIRYKQIELLPLSSLLAIYLFGLIFFHFMMQLYFKKHGVTQSQGFILPITLILFIPFLIVFSGVSNSWTYILIPLLGTFFLIYLRKNKTEFLSLATALLKK